MTLGKRVGRLLGRPGAPTRGSGKSGAAKQRVPIVDRGRFDVSVMAILKDEAPYMEEWLCHHMAIGVDHFFLYDNGSTDELHEILKPYADHGIVTTVYFPLRGLQRDANNHVVRFFGHTTEWLAYVDIDEFLVPADDEQIGTVMGRFPDAQQVLVSRKEFCYSGHRSPPDGLVTQSYRMVSEQVPRMGSSDILAKPIIRPVHIARVGIHFALTVDGATVNTAGEPTQEDANNIERPSYANLQMNHYYTKSLEEFQAKRNRATTSTHSFLLPDVPFDIPAESDEAIDRWIPRTKAMMEKMRLIARSPSRYGSQLHMKGFPIADLFGTEATTVVSNEAAGLAEPRRRKSFNSLPLPGIRGAMARAEDHGYEPSMGRFLASPHLAQELAWLDAEVSWHLGLARPKLHIEGGRLEEADGRSTVSFEAASGSIIMPRGGPPWRCHALLFALEVAGPTDVEIAASKAGTWHTDMSFEIPGAGSYLGLIALEKRPRSIDAVRLDFSEASEVTLYDLALLSFG